MKKILWVIGLTIGMVQSSLVANYCPTYNQCETDCCDDWCDGWTLYGDYLYWNVRKCNLDYAVSTAEEEVAGGMPFPRGKIHAVDPDYTSGFRIGIAKTFCDWDVGLRYTYLRPSDTDSFNTSEVLGVAAPTRLYAGLLGDNLLTARASYKVDLDVFDIEFGRDYQPWCSTTFRLFSGVKIARIDQTLQVDLSGEDYSAESSVITQKSSIDMNAYGLYIGAHGTHDFWDFCGCGQLGLFGDFSIGTLVGDIDRKLKSDGILESTPFNLVDVHDNCCRLLGNLNFAVGLSYTMADCFCGDFTLSIGYEMNLWLNTSDFLTMNLTEVVPLVTAVNPIQNISSARNQDTLGFDGLVVRLAVGF